MAFEFFLPFVLRKPVHHRIAMATCHGRHLVHRVGRERHEHAATRDDLDWFTVVWKQPQDTAAETSSRVCVTRALEK